MPFQRAQKQLLESRLAESRGFVQVVYGPRQVGKTTMIQQVLADLDGVSHYASADAVGGGGSGTVWISQQWETARIMLHRSGAKSIILALDEVQKVENWSEAVKHEWDADTRSGLSIKVVLLGSSRLLLQQGLTESLVGRFETIYLGHWSFQEMKAAFDLSAEDFVWFGGYPGSTSLIQDEPRWKQYVRDSLIEASISKDILMLTRVNKPALMKRLFELGCLYSGQIVSYSKLVGQLHEAGNTTTLAHYLELLQSAGLLGGLEKFSPNRIRQRSSSPKFVVHNTALVSAQSEDSFSMIRREPERWGRLVETAVGAHLMNFSLTESFDFFYWRDRNDEVDYVLRKGDKVIGIEVKSGFSGKTAGMAAFRKRFNPDKMYLVGKNGLPWEDLLAMNPVELL